MGTQKIASEFLPSNLLSALPMESWTELPLMSRDGAFQWLLFQLNSGRINLELHDWQDRGAILHDVADAFFMLSQGLPLHLIYSFETMVLSGRAGDGERGVLTSRMSRWRHSQLLHLSLGAPKAESKGHTSRSGRPTVRPTALRHG